MRPRSCIVIAAVCALLVPAADAHAAKTELFVRSCQTGGTPAARTATFYARMYAVKRSKRMAIRFTLINRAGAGRAIVVSSPVLARWRKSRRGVARFGYAQSVEGLAQGGVYAMHVQFRWLDSHGVVIRSAKRTSGDCTQQGELPNLSVTHIAASAGQASGAETYGVDVTNSGQGDAQSVRVNLFVDGVAADTYQLDSLKAGETVTVRFTGPSCKHWLRAVADPRNRISETNENDNALRVRCPPIA